MDTPDWYLVHYPNSLTKYLMVTRDLTSHGLVDTQSVYTQDPASRQTDEYPIHFTSTLFVLFFLATSLVLIPRHRLFLV